MRTLPNITATELEPAASQRVPLHNILARRLRGGPEKVPVCLFHYRAGINLVKQYPARARKARNKILATTYKQFIHLC